MQGLNGVSNPLARLCLRTLCASAAQLKALFPDVTVAKPRSSRNSSVEAFAVCRGYAPPPGFDAGRLAALLANAADRHAGAPPVTRAERLLVPFLACGDLSGCRPLQPT